MGDLLTKTVFEKNNACWKDAISTVTKHTNNKKPSTTKITLTEASWKKERGISIFTTLTQMKENKTKN